MGHEKIKLNPLETLSYFVIWISTVLYVINKVYIIGNYFKHDFDSEDFSSGWIFNRKKDISDYEWNVWIPLLWILAPWFAIHLIMSEFIRWINLKFLPLWYIVLPSVLLIRMFGVICAATFLIQPVIFELIAVTSKRRLITWITSLAVMAFMNTHPFTQEWSGLSQDESYFASVVQMWIHLRCLSYCLEVQTGAEHCSLLNLLAYSLYLPLNFFGPLILYSEFRPSLEKEFSAWTVHRLCSFVFGVMRYVFWLLVNEVWLHLIYSSALSFQPDIVASLDTTTLYGLGYCFGQFFMNKYTVVYGLPGVLARAERVPAPQPPKCIGRIHLYSEMWRTFDQGLYNFLSKYIYIPVSSSRRDLKFRAVASLLCFAFVYLWHGTMMYILIWSVLNFIGVSIEAVARRVASNPSFKSWEMSWFGPRGTRRFHAAITAPLLFMSALSNFYFFAGQEVGNIFVIRSLEGFRDSSLVVLVLLYCCCQVSEEIKQWELQREPNKEKN